MLGSGGVSSPSSQGWDAGQARRDPFPSPRHVRARLSSSKPGNGSSGEAESQIPKLFWCGAAADAGASGGPRGAPAELGHLLGLCPSHKRALLPPDPLHPGLFIAAGSVCRRSRARHLRGTVRVYLGTGLRRYAMSIRAAVGEEVPLGKTNVGWLCKARGLRTWGRTG